MVSPSAPWMEVPISRLPVTMEWYGYSSSESMNCWRWLKLRVTCLFTTAE